MQAIARVRRAQSGIRSAFTLIELMIVLIIIAVVIAIVLPALSGSRNAARGAATKALMNQLGSASAQFNIDNRRNPGYFAVTTMANAQNVDARRGFTGMENVLLDLCGGITTSPRDMGNGSLIDETPNGPRVVTVGPDATIPGGPGGGPANVPQVVNVDLRLIGTNKGSSKAYYTPDPKLFKRQAALGQKLVTVDDHKALPDLVDAFGTPLLAWSQNESVGNATYFGLNKLSDANPDRALFYRGTNMAFLDGGRVGAGAVNMGVESLLGSTYLNVTRDTLAGQNVNPGSLSGVLGNPAFPRTTADLRAPACPSAGRGTLIFHSAGQDGVYVGKSNPGGKKALVIDGINPPGTIRYNKPNDAMLDFDDVLSAAGN